MVWIKLIIFYFIFLTSIKASDLSKDEKNYFNIMDLNNDGYVSIDEINQSMNIIFQLIDFDQNGFISKSEINELKNIIDSLR